MVPARTNLKGAFTDVDEKRRETHISPQRKMRRRVQPLLRGNFLNSGSDRRVVDLLRSPTVSLKEPRFSTLALGQAGWKFLQPLARKHGSQQVAR